MTDKLELYEGPLYQALVTLLTVAPTQKILKAYKQCVCCGIKLCRDCTIENHRIDHLNLEYSIPGLIGDPIPAQYHRL